MEVSTALVRLGGVADSRSLRALVSARQIAAAMQSGAIVRLRRGLYAVGDVDAARAARRRVGGVLSLESAALEWGWQVRKPPQRPVVTVPRNRCVDEDAVEVRYADLPVADIAGNRTSRVRTVVDCCRLLSRDRALCVTDSALKEGVVTRAELVAGAQAGPRTYRAKALAVIALGSPKSANPFESVMRALALDVPGLRVEPQCPIVGPHGGPTGPSGEPLHADLGDRALQIAVEGESWEWHGTHAAFDYDIRRYTAMVRHGWLVVRFTWDDVMHKPDYVRAVLLDLVALRTEQVA